MGVSWTEEQQKVIDLRDRNILVSAAAGSGKTAVLVERIIKMLTSSENPVSVDQLLIVTFTEAAAAEMKERIRNAIENELEKHPENEHLRLQATLIHNALITTIHSFCLSVIRDHFHEIDLDPGFRIGEEGELKLLKHDVLNEVLEQKYQEADSRFLDFVGVYGGAKNDKKIEELILKVYEYSRSYPDSKAWLTQCTDTYRVFRAEELEQGMCANFAMEIAKLYLEDAWNMAEQALDICREDDGPSFYESAISKDCQQLEQLLGKKSYTELQAAFAGFSFVRLAPKKGDAYSVEKAEQVKNIRDNVKKSINDLKDQFFSMSVSEVLESMAICLPYVQELVELVEIYGMAFENKKRSMNMIDFSDMEQYAMRILTRNEEGRLIPSPAAVEYQQQFSEIMIDEYQDSNNIQEAILTSVSTVSAGRYNIFMVGDVKQSIYRFRLSRPELFMEKFETYDTEDGEKQRIDLHKNFRSRKEVLDSVNYIFYQIMTAMLGNITYNRQAALNVGADYEESEGFETEILVLDKDDEINSRELEARMIAGRIRKLMQEQLVTDKHTGELRAVKYSDIVLLTRSVKGYADIYSEVLNREGIPCYSETREGYFQTSEIGLILDYLGVLNNRKQDIPLTAVLASPIGGLKEEELAIIKCEYPDIFFHDAVEIYREEKRETLIGVKLERCLGTMDRLREITPYTPIHELLSRVLEETGYGRYVAAMPNGSQRIANLDMLLEKASAFESTSYKGLFHFIRYMKQLQKYDVDYGEASIDDEKSDTVRIMTIHKSKGLEFPVVFVAGMGKNFNLQDARSSVVLHSQMGIGIDAVNLEERTKSPCLVKKIIQKKEVFDSLGEELRVLYVALTRAKEKLILTGVVDNYEAIRTKYERIRSRTQPEFPFPMLAGASCYWDWILPAVERLNPEVPIRVCSLRAEDVVFDEVVTEKTADYERQQFEAWDTAKRYDSNMREHMEQQFGYVYPHEGSRLTKQKLSVSELKKRIYEEESAEEQDQLYERETKEAPLPKFMEEEVVIQGALRGTAYHRIMELVEFRRGLSLENLQEMIRDWICEGRIEEELAECVNPEDVLLFLHSETGKRMCDASAKQRLWKEQPFVLGVDQREICPDSKENECILVQGIIDAYFEESDGIVLLDYKTDRVRTGEELIEHYHGQLDYYAKALERLTGKNVKEKAIYSFTLKEEIFLK